MSEEIGDDEAREAEALAAALERGHAGDDLPEDALKVAAMLRYSAGGGALSSERHDAILEDVLKSADRVAARHREAAPRSIWRWLFGAAGLTTAVAAALLIVLRPRPVDPSALPTPSAALVSAQIARLSGEDDAELDEAMRGYRGDVYAALTERYGAR